VEFLHILPLTKEFKGFILCMNINIEYFFSQTTNQNSYRDEIIVACYAAVKSLLQTGR